MNKRPDTGTVAVAEISGADSIAATLRFCEQSRGVRTVLPTYVHTGTEFGDFGGIKGNLAFLGEELQARFGMALLPLKESGKPRLWQALNGRFGSVLAARHGAWVPCVGCHLYLHLMRVHVARTAGAVAVISGEREWHGTSQKPNQDALALDAYATVLADVGVRLEYPVRDVAEATAIEAILGERWPGGSPQLECVLSGNYRGLDGGGRAPALPGAFFEEFLVPVGIRLADAVANGRTNYDDIVAGVLREAGATL
ncbi:MAG: hypothetical protein Q7V61_08770 [Actinomycetota bacterium]|nr:hypothetical protein [Actinomycetota bacterium]